MRPLTGTDATAQAPHLARATWPWHGTRRGFLRAGVLGALLLPLSLPLRAVRAAEERYGAFRSPQHRSALRACAARVLSDVLPVEAGARAGALETVLTGCGGYMAQMPLPVRQEALDALDLLDITVVRWLLGGPWSGWESAPPGEVDAFLDGLRTSRFALKRNLYQFLHDMGLVGWFANPDSWPLLEYPGPPVVPRPEGEKPL